MTCGRFAIDMILNMRSNVSLGAELLSVAHLQNISPIT